MDVKMFMIFKKVLMSLQIIKEICVEACRQTLELAADKVLERKFSDGNVEYFVHSKQAILTTINQIV